MARHLQLSVKGSSPAGDAAKAQHQRQIFDVYVWAEQETKKQQLPPELGFSSGWPGGKGCTVVEVSAHAGDQEAVQTEDLWVHGLVFQGVSRSGSQKQMEMVVVAPPYCIWNCDCCFSKCLLENIHVSACHWGLKAPIWMWSPYGFPLSFSLMGG